MGLIEGCTQIPPLPANLPLKVQFLDLSVILGNGTTSKGGIPCMNPDDLQALPVAGRCVERRMFRFKMAQKCQKRPKMPKIAEKIPKTNQCWS